MADKNFFTLLILLLLAGLNDSWASTSTSAKTPVMSPIMQTNPVLQKEQEPLKENFSGSVGLSYSGNMFDQASYEASRDLGLEFVPTYIFSEFSSVSAKINLDREFFGQENVEILALANIPVTFSYKRFQLFKSIDISNRLVVALPANELIRRRDSYNGAIGLGTDFGYKVQSFPLDLQIGFTLSKNFHEYEINRDGKPNNSFVFSTSFLAKYKVQKFTISASGAYKKAQSYGGFERDTFLNGIEVEYAHNDSYAFQMGTKNEGSALKANGKDSNFEFFNENTSALYAGLSYSF